MADAEIESAAAADHPASLLEPSSYIQTTTHNYVSRKAAIDGPKQVELKGRCIVGDGVRIRGDLGPIRIGRYCLLETNTIIQPPSLVLGQMDNKYDVGVVPVTIGSHTCIGKDCVLEAAAVGSLCWIGSAVKIGERSIIKDCCVVAERTVIPADTVIPPFSRVVSTENGRLVTTPLPPSVAVELQERAVEAFQDFVATQRKQR